jgi:hypothetical protein
MEELKYKKAKSRSPSYPIIGLKEAIEKVTLIHNKDYQNPIPRIVAASHMGYQGLNGKSLGVLSALGKFGLLEGGRGDDSRVSDLAKTIIAYGPNTPERIEAIKEAASKVELFNELDSRFSNGKASDAGIRSYLLMQKFIPSAADNVIRSYRETKQFIESESTNYSEINSEVEPSIQLPSKNILDKPIDLVHNQPIENAQTGIRRTVFALSEGDVIITCPNDLSQESVLDLADYLETFMKITRREAGIK